MKKTSKLFNEFNKEIAKMREEDAERKKRI